MLTRPVTVALLWVLSISAGPARTVPDAAGRAIERVSQLELRTHVERLASDELAGRGFGEDGNRRAEQYIAGVFRDTGVRPAVRDYLQRIEIYVSSPGPNPRLSVTGRDGSMLADMTVGQDFSALPESGDAEVTGRLVFAGHGLSAPDWRHDDYRDLDTRGAVVLALEHAPAWMQQTPGLTPAQKTEAFGIDRKIADARAHGAAGLIVVRARPAGRASGWPLSPGATPTYRDLAALRSRPLAVAALSTEAARPIRRALDEGAVLTARLAPDVVVTPVIGHNVLGMLEGRDPAAGMVVVGAHLDHDGVDDAGQIYNGADDNASGTAAVLAVAAALTRSAAAGQRPARPIVFALWNGEEQGSLGADYFLRSMARTRKVVANINLDMVGRSEDVPDPGDPRFMGFGRTKAARNVNVVHLLGYSYSPDLARIVNLANEPVRLKIRASYDRGAQNLLRRSDHWPFLKRGIPAVFLTTGLHPDYHTPEDDVERIDFAKLERIAELAARVAWLTADGEAPRFRAE